MTRNKSFWRKVIYLCGIAGLLVPLALISAPARTADSGGGVLTRMRRDERLSQSQLGKVDPASASMTLATLGMRGVAANRLWAQSEKYKRTENWDAFKATLNQISKLQPNFVSVWQYQSWNISYNVSVEFDNFEHRYHWVKKGVDYLLEGSEYNRNDPMLLWDTGWFFGHKIGRADEYRQFRRLFRDDDDFHAKLPVDFDNPDNQGPDTKPDNWKAAHVFFSRGERAVDSGARLKSLQMGYWQGQKRIIGKKETPLKGKNPLVFFSDPPKALIKYANAIEEEGYLNEIGQLAWRTAGKAWEVYGQRPIISTYGVKIRLADRERNVELADEANKKLEELAIGIREKLLEDRRSKLTSEQLEAADTDPFERTEVQRTIMSEIGNSLEITQEDIAKAAPSEVRKEAKKWARQAMEAEEQVRIIDRYRDIVNYVYWKKRCEAEQLDITVKARQKVIDADKAFAEADLETAKELYEEAWDYWAEVFDQFDELVDDVEGEIVYESVEKYQRVLSQLDESFPPPGFKLYRLLEEFGDDYVSPESLDSESEHSHEGHDHESETDKEGTGSDSDEFDMSEPDSEDSAAESPEATKDTSLESETGDSAEAMEPASESEEGAVDQPTEALEEDPQPSSVIESETPAEEAPVEDASDEDAPDKDGNENSPIEPESSGDDSEPSKNQG